VFSLGITLFSLKYKKEPINIKSDYEEFFETEINFFFPDKPEVPEEFKTLIKGMLHPKPDKRYTLEKIEKSDWLNNSTEEELKIMQDRLDKSIEKTKNFREGNLLYWNS
jgi:serine/threonine protein kinase